MPNRAGRQPQAANAAREDGTGGDTWTTHRSAAKIVLLPTDCLADETAAFDVLVNGVYAGHWAETNVGGTAVTWVGGKWIETERCEGDEERVIAAIRSAIPTPQLEPDPLPEPR